MYIEITLLPVRYRPYRSRRQFPVDKLLALCPVAMLVVLVLPRQDGMDGGAVAVDIVKLHTGLVPRIIVLETNTYDFVCDAS